MSKTISLLFLAANPKNTPSLRLDEEIRGIDLALREAEFRDRFDIKQHWAVRVTDLQGYLLRHKPDIVHFSGHGGASSEIILEDNYGNSHPVSPHALSQVFSVLKDNIRCVVLNACYSEPQAQAIAQHIDCVVGMSQAIGDTAAISFSMAFYQALGYGRNVKTAFDLGCAQIDLDNLNEQDIPRLLALSSNPEEVYFSKQRNRLSYWVPTFLLPKIPASYPRIALTALVGQILLIVALVTFVYDAIKYPKSPGGPEDSLLLGIVALTFVCGVVGAAIAFGMSLSKTKQLQRWGWFTGLIIGFIGLFILFLPALIPLFFGLFGPKEQRAAQTRSQLEG